MNALSNIGKQIAELIAAMTPAARVMAALMAGVIVVSLGWIIAAKSSDNYESLLGGIPMTNEELDRVESAFGGAQLGGYTRIGRQIRVPSSEKDRYLKALADADALPREWGSEIDRALSNGNVFESTEKFSARIQNSQERELAGILKRMPGIEFAAVKFDEKRTGFGRPSDRVCSIHVQGPHNTPIPDGVMKQIAIMAQTSFAGLSESNIAVMDLGTANVYRKGGNAHALDENPVLTAQREWEKHYVDKLTSVLRDYGAVELMVNVELDPTLVEESEKLQYDPTAITLQSSESRRDAENAKPPPGGPPGTDINGLGNKPQSLTAGAASQTSKTKESEANERRVAGHEAVIRKMAGLRPRKVSVSIGIPDSHYRNVLAHRFLLANPDKTSAEVPLPDAAELANLESEIDGAVRAAVEGIAIGAQDATTGEPYVKVYRYTDLPLPAFPQPTLAENSLAWLKESWSTLALLAVVLVSLGMMFSWVKSQSLAEDDKKFAEGFGLQVPQDVGDELELSGDADMDDGALAGGRPKPAFDNAGNEMREDLSALIKENPDAAVNLLKTWIGEAA